MTFWKSLVAFICGVACQVLAALFPDLTAILAPTGSLLLGASNVGKWLNGSLWKHSLVFGLGLLFQIAAVKASWVSGVLRGAPEGIGAMKGALLAAGGLLGAAADIGRILGAIRPATGPGDALPPTQAKS